MKCHNCRIGISRSEAIAKDGFYYCKACAEVVNKKAAMFSLYGNTVHKRSEGIRDESLRDFLKRTRIDSGISQEKLAEMFDVGQSKICRIEKGSFSCYNILEWYFKHGMTHARAEDGRESDTNQPGSEGFID